MFKKVAVWKVVLTLVILAALAFGGAMLFRAGYVRGMASNFEMPEYHQMDMDESPEMEMPFDRYPFGRTPYDRHSWYYKSFPRMSPGLFCFGGLIFLLVFIGLGIYLNRRWIYRKHGPSDPWHFWAPPPHHDEKIPRDGSPKSSPDDVE